MSTILIDLTNDDDEETQINESGIQRNGKDLSNNDTWKVVLLMDYQEFNGRKQKKDFIRTKISNAIMGQNPDLDAVYPTQVEIGNSTVSSTDNSTGHRQCLPVGDYMFVARLISSTTGKVIDERVIDMVIERKNVTDVCNCLVTDSKKYKPGSEKADIREQK